MNHAFSQQNDLSYKYLLKKQDTLCKAAENIISLLQLEKVL